MSLTFSNVSFLPLRFNAAGSRLITATIVLFCVAPASGQVSEKSSRWIRGVAQVSLDRSGRSQIKFNPRRCRELGPELCEFFRTHEYGHVNLRHLERGVSPAQAEAEADIWAARNASPAAVQAAKKFFLSGQGGSRIHGTPQERARRMDARASTTVSVDRSNRRLTKKMAPKRYAGTSRRIAQYVLNPGKVNITQKLTTNPKTAQPAVIASKSAIVVVPRIVRYSAENLALPSRSGGRTSAGYVPRGDFLNPR